MADVPPIIVSRENAYGHLRQSRGFVSAPFGKRVDCVDGDARDARRRRDSFYIPTRLSFFPPPVSPCLHSFFRSVRCLLRRTKLAVDRFVLKLESTLAMRRDRREDRTTDSN